MSSCGQAFMQSAVCIRKKCNVIDSSRDLLGSGSVTFMSLMICVVDSFNFDTPQDPDPQIRFVKNTDPDPTFFYIFFSDYPKIIRYQINIDILIKTKKNLTYDFYYLFKVKK